MRQKGQTKKRWKLSTVPYKPCSHVRAIRPTSGQQRPNSLRCDGQRTTFLRARLTRSSKAFGSKPRFREGAAMSDCKVIALADFRVRQQSERRKKADSLIREIAENVSASAIDWETGYHDVQRCDHLRHAAWHHWRLVSDEHGVGSEAEHDAKWRREAAYSEFLRACARQMFIEAPTIRALRWKQKQTFADRHPEFIKAVARDEAQYARQLEQIAKRKAKRKRAAS